MSRLKTAEALGLAVVLALASATALAADCLSYEPATVSLTGIVHSRIGYGPPGYGENPDLDSRDHYQALFLDEPFCVSSDDETFNPPEKNVWLLTLVLPSASVRVTDGQRVQVTGTLSHSITGHQHTRVSLQVKTLR